MFAIVCLKIKHFFENVMEKNKLGVVLVPFPFLLRIGFSVTDRHKKVNPPETHDSSAQGEALYIFIYV